MIGTCRCGCVREAHRHYRYGTDCAFCGFQRCPRYRTRWPWSRTRIPEEAPGA